MCSSVLGNPSLIHETNDKDNPSNPHSDNGLWKQYHYDPYYSLAYRTPEADVNGMVRDTLVISENIDLLRDGSVGMIDNSFGFDCDLDTNTPSEEPTKDFCSGNGPLALAINFGESGSSTTQNTAGGFPTIRSNYQGYDFNAGHLDRGGGMKAATVGDPVHGSSEFAYDFGGFTNGSIIEGINSVLPLDVQFTMPSQDECLGGMDRCWGEGWEYFFPMCGNMDDCNASNHNSHLQIGNGFQSRNAYDWAINTNFTRSNLLYSIPLDKLNMLDSNGEQIANFLWRSNTNTNWSSIETITHHQSAYIEYRLAYDPVYYMQKCLDTSLQNNELFCIMPHDVLGRTPNIELYNTTTNESHLPQPISTIKYDATQNVVYFSIGYDTTEMPISNITDFANQTGIEYFEENHVVYDPATGYLGGQSFRSGNQDGAILDNTGFTADGYISTIQNSWHFATDRDGGAIYGYGESAGGYCDENKDYPSTSASFTANFREQCRWWTSNWYDEVGLTDLTGDWGNHKVGDGWCQSSGYDRNAGCRVQGIDTSSFGNHWNVEADMGLASLPLIDSTKDFDGMIVQMELPRYQWTSQVNRGGWEDVHIELGLQAMAYSPSGMLISDTSLQDTTIGSLLGAQGGWYETCANGYLDIFIVPEADFHAWYGHGKYGFIYDYDGVINAQNSLSDTTITDVNHERYGVYGRTVFGGGMPDGRFNYPHINWNIAPDDDKITGLVDSAEYWYDEVGNSNNLYELDSFVDDGHRRGPSSEATAAGNTWVDTEEANDNSPEDWIQYYMTDAFGNQIAERDGSGSMWTMDEDSPNYWGEIYTHSTGYTFGDAHYKQNPFHPFNVEDNRILYDRMFEQPGIDSAYFGERAVGSYDEAYVDGVYDSSFNHVNDYHDINIYTNQYYEDLPLGPIGRFDAAGGQIQSDGSFAPTSALQEYHLKTIELGSAESDFCYDPNSAGGNGVARVDSTGYQIEPDSSTLIQHNSANGQTYLNIPLKNAQGYFPFDAGAGLVDIANYQPSSTVESMVSDGWLRDSTDPTIGFIMMVDYRGREGPQKNVCWGDWSFGTDIMDGNGGEWLLYGPDVNQDGVVDELPITDLARPQRTQFCLDEGNPSLLSGSAGENIDFDTFTDDNSCVNDEPVAQSTGLAPNSDKGFWCGLSFISPMSSTDTVVIKANTKPFIPVVDSDGDGVLDTDDICPSTPIFSWVDTDGDGAGDVYINTPVDREGCPTNQPVPPYGGNNDYDGDGVADLFDKCDGQSTSATQQVGYATDYSSSNPFWFQGGGYAHSQTYLAMTGSGVVIDGELWQGKPPVDSDGCPILTNGFRDSQAFYDSGNGQGQTDNTTVIDACSNLQQDLGIYYWENNDNDYKSDGSPKIDEDDPFDKIDNDGDGKEGEDPFDDCPNDGIDNRGSSTFEGNILGSISHEANGLALPNTGYIVIAENQSNPVKDAGIHALPNYDGSGITSNTANTLYSDTLIKEDNFRQASIHCDWRGVGNTLPNMKMEIYVWVDEGTLQQVLSKEVQTNPSASSIDDLIYFTEFGYNPSGVYTNPAGTGEAGRYVPYGSIIQNGVVGAGNLLPVGYSGWSASTIGQGDIASEVGPRTAKQLTFEGHFAEGYYKMSCEATQIQTTPSGQQYSSVISMDYDFKAVNLCPDGTMGEPPLPFVNECSRTTGGGIIDLTEEGSLLGALFESVVALAIILVILGLAALFWFIERRGEAVGIGVAGLGIGAGYLANTGDLSNGMLIGSIAHVLILLGLLVFINRFFARADSSAQNINGLFVFGLFSIWFTIHSLASLEVISEPFFYVPAYAWLATLAAFASVAFLAVYVSVSFDIIENEFVEDLSQITYSEF